MFMEQIKKRKSKTVLFYRIRRINVLILSAIFYLLPAVTNKAFANSPDNKSVMQSNGFVAKGTIVDETGEPAIGATISIKGTTVGVISDVDGKFEIKVPSNKTTLVFSYIGFNTKEVLASENMNIVLESNSQVLTEVVVTGITKMDKRMFTGATTKLTNDDVKSTVYLISVDRLRGVLPGLLYKTFQEHLVLHLKFAYVVQLQFSVAQNHYGL